MGVSSVRLKLNLVNLNDSTIEQFAEEQVKKESKSIRNKGLGLYDSYLEAFDDLLSDKYFRKGDKVYRIASEVENESDILVVDNKDNTFDVMIYYNNGADTWQSLLRDVDKVL
jgi:uncharacterized protein YaaN involved in tellurite resistance